jgi:hypothetical protein
MHDGIGWGPARQVTDYSTGSKFPSIAADSQGNVYLVWQCFRWDRWRIYFSTYDGEAWGPDTEFPGTGQTPAVAVDGGDSVHVAWYAGVYSSSVLMYRRFNGTSWTERDTIQVANSIWAPSIAADANGRIHVCWHDKRYAHGYEVFYLQHDGIQWLPAERISEAESTSHNTSVAAGDDGRVFVVWADDRDGNNEIYWRLFDGSQWQWETRLTDAPGESRFPCALLDQSGNLHVVWYDERDGNPEIYYDYRDIDAIGGVPGDPAEAHLSWEIRVVPNPARDAAGIRFDPGFRTPAEIGVYDIAGRLVWKHLSAPGTHGMHRTTWQGRDAAGKKVAPGVYFLRVTAGAQTTSAKVIVLK